MLYWAAMLTRGIYSKAWNDYVEKAIEEAADKPTDSKDWVLNSRQSDDLTFSVAQSKLESSSQHFISKNISRNGENS